MCQTAPGNRCASHLKQQIRKTTSEMSDLLLKEGVPEPQMLAGKAEHKYRMLQTELNGARLDYSTTREGQNGLARQIRAAEEEGDEDKVEKLTRVKARGAEIKARRDQALKDFRANEKEAKKEVNDPAKASAREVEIVNNESTAVVQAVQAVGRDTRTTRRKAHQERYDHWESVAKNEAKVLQGSRKRIASLADAGESYEDEMKFYRESYEVHVKSQETAEWHKAKLATLQPRTRAPRPSPMPEPNPTPTHYFSRGGCGGRRC